MKYSDNYYNSAYWETRREFVLRDWDGVCEECGEVVFPDSPHVHHKYGKEGEYRILCADCHADIHDNDNLRLIGRCPRCKYCGAPIHFLENTYGKKYPVNPETEEEHICEHVLKKFREDCKRQTQWDFDRGFLWKG